MSSKQRSRNLIIAGIAALFLFFCIGSFTFAGAITFLLVRSDDDQPVQVRVVEQPAAVATPTDSRRPPSKEPAQSPDIQPERTPSPVPNTTEAELKIEYITEQELASVIVPTRDLRDLALRLRPGIDEIPLITVEEEPVYEIGDEIQFWVSNVDTNQQSQITAALIHKTDVAYVWVQINNDYDLQRIAQSVDHFSEDVYPLVREFFGSEWSPGVDDDARLHILHANEMGASVAGYYSSADEFSRLANPYSNEKEMFYISLDWLNRTQDYEYYETVLAHEFQHMIHWYNDRNEETWVNEGLSELAQEIAGYPPDTGFASIFASVPDTQLNTWSEVSGSNGEHYGSSYLLMAYLLQRFGDEVTQAIVAHPANGIAGVAQALDEAGYDLSFNKVFADWVVANYIGDPDALSQPGLYGYRQLNPPRPVLDETHRRFPVEMRRTTVHNYGTDYIELQGRGDVTIHFQGETESRLANVSPYSGDLMWWGNRADDSNSRLTRRFDFTEVETGESLEMQVTMWYQIEEDYDYGYVLVSEDDEKWDILPGQSTTTENPSGNSFGHAYTGLSLRNDSTPEWITETFDLSDYAGKEVLIRFEYVTDDAVNAPGWFVDDISIPAIAYNTDFEAGAEGWESEGWILTDNRLPQHWLVQILALADDKLIDVIRVPVNADGSATIDVDGLGGSDTAVLVVSGMTPVTTEVAQYEYRIEER
jgi:hypothetical protein